MSHLHRSRNPFHKIRQRPHIPHQERLLHPSRSSLTLSIHPDRRISQLLGRHNIIFKAEARVPDLRHLQPQSLPCEEKPFVVRLVGTCLLGGDNVIELHADSALGLGTYIVVSIRYKHNFYKPLQFKDCVFGIWKWIPGAHVVGKFFVFFLARRNTVLIEGHSQDVLEYLPIGSIFFLNILKLDFFPMLLHSLRRNISEAFGIHTLREESLPLFFPLYHRPLPPKDYHLSNLNHSI